MKYTSGDIEMTIHLLPVLIDIAIKQAMVGPIGTMGYTGVRKTLACLRPHDHSRQESRVASGPLECKTGQYMAHPVQS